MGSMAYQVITMQGDFEPWWFLDGWQDDILAVKEFQSYESALAYYQKKWQHLKAAFPKVNSKANMMAAFWTLDERRWCAECDEEMQQFHSLLLLENWQELPKPLQVLDFERHNANAMQPSCSLKQYGSWDKKG